MSETTDVVRQLVTLRILVGFLGEKRQSKWWDCGFLDQTGARFLQTTFPRTFVCSAVRSTTEAARIVHDARIGRVGIFHLFRLPVDIEDQLESCVPDVSGAYKNGLDLSVATALEQLAACSDRPVSAPEGPVQVGTPKKILSFKSVSDLAAHYHYAFSHGFHCFPYFATVDNAKH